MPIATLEISTWRGVSIGAVHYYGKIRCYPSEVPDLDIERVLTKDAAFKLTKQKNAGRNPERCWFDYSEGDKSNEFDSKDEIREIALRVWKEHFPDAVMLQEGRSAVADPQRVLAADDPKLMIKFNKMWERAEEIGYYDGGHEEEMCKISNKYWSIVTEEEA